MALEFKDLARLKWYYQVLLVAVVCGGLLGLFWYEVLSGMQEDVDAKKVKAEELQRVVARSEAQSRELERIKKEALELEAKLDMLKAVLPLDKETDQIFRAISYLPPLP